MTHASPDSYPVRVTGWWMDDNYVPPRCRKPRRLERPMEATAHVPMVTGDQAPVAFRLPLATYERTENADMDDLFRTIRSYNGELFAPEKTSRVSAMKEALTPQEFFAGTWDFRYLPSESDQEWVASAQDRLNQFLIIDGIVWAVTDEPRYYVHTGYSHVSLLVSRQVERQAVFRADEFEAAQAEAIRMVRDREGTDASIEHIERVDPIEVVDPAQVRLVTNRESHEVQEARADLSEATSRYYRDRDVLNGSYEATVAAEAERWEALVAARERLLSLTDDVPGYGAAQGAYRE